MLDTDKTSEFLRFQIHRKVINLYKQFLFLIEDLEISHNLTPEEKNRIRKRVLDVGNDALREIDGCLDKINVSIK